MYTPIPEHLRRNVAMSSASGVFSEAIEKESALQHAGYMVLVRKLPCAHCGRAGPSQFCHSDEGKGMAIKSDCRLGWPGCGDCHHAIGTKRIYQRDERRSLEDRYAAQTRAAILAAGLWPKTLPLWTKS